MTGSAQDTAEFPAYFPLSMSHHSSDSLPGRRPHRLPPDVWPEIQERAKRESLRHLAAEYGVSHEAIRRIVNMKGTNSSAESTSQRIARPSKPWSHRPFDRNPRRQRRGAAWCCQGLWTSGTIGPTTCDPQEFMNLSRAQGHPTIGAAVDAYVVEIPGTGSCVGRTERRRAGGDPRCADVVSLPHARRGVDVATSSS